MSIDKFPPELLVQVLSCLDVNDLLNCRLINRQWKATIECHIRIHGLTVEQKEGDRWQFLTLTSPSMDSNRRFVSRCSGNFTKSPFMKSMLKKLKKLSVDKSHLKVLRSLNRLGVENLFVRSVDRRLTIKSTHLRTLAVHWNPLKAKLRLNTPNLSKIDFHSQVNYRDTFQFVGTGDPRSVTHLSALKFSEIFRQLSNLKVCYLADSEGTPADLLKLFPVLHLLHFARCRAPDVSAFLSSKRKLRRTEFKLYYLGLPIDKTKDLSRGMERFVDNYPRIYNYSDIGFVDIGYVARYLHVHRYRFIPTEWATPPERTRFDVLLSNYCRLPSPLPYNVFVNYRSLNRHFHGQIDRDFFAQFVNIRFLNVEKRVGDKKQFVWFVRNCKQLEKLVIKNAGLDQKFYDQLPCYWPSSPELAIDEGQKLDWEFLLRFKRFQHLTTSQEVSFSIVVKAIQKFDTLNYFEFKYQRQVQIPFDLIDLRFPNRKTFTEEQLFEILRYSFYDPRNAYSTLYGA